MKLRWIPALLSKILLRGKLRHSGFDFRENRRQVLSGLREFCPSSIDRSRTRKASHPVLQTLHAEAAYFKRSLSFKGNHLACGHASLSYIRIPRSASTMISKAILEKNMPGLKTHELSAMQINFLADVHLHRNLAQDQFGRQFFTVVRNPFARIASVYHQFFLEDHGPFIYEDYLFGILKKQFSFAEFVRTAMLIPDTLKDQHLKPQHLFLDYYERNKIPVTVLRLEDTGIMDAYLRKYGLVAERFNTSRQPYDYRRLYDPETLRNVYSIYKTDVVRFGYQDIFTGLNKCL